jgi:hypothetical protein
MPSWSGTGTTGEFDEIDIAPEEIFKSEEYDPDRARRTSCAGRFETSCSRYLPV